MPSLTLTYQDFAGWPDALWIQARSLTLILVPQIGGRIMGLRWADGQYLGWTSQFSVFSGEPYGHGCTAEVFNASDYGYLEVEIHSLVRTLAPGESLRFVETNCLALLDNLPVTSSDVAAIKLLGARC